MLKIDKVSISFGSRKILDDISLEINERSIVAITGKSGTGKSTLLGIISGLMKPDSGKVFFENQDIYRWSDFKRSRFRNRKMGFVFQFFSLLPEVTAYENIMYPAILNPFTSKNIKDEIKELIDFLKLGDIADQYPSTLSGGERQRVAIARAIINKPRIILADEPTGNLDDDTTYDIIDLFKKLKEERGITTLLATHEKKLVENSDISYNLENGALSLQKRKKIRSGKKSAPTLRAVEEKKPAKKRPKKAKP